jgi:hypothetical protein
VFSEIPREIPDRTTNSGTENLANWLRRNARFIPSNENLVAKSIYGLVTWIRITENIASTREKSSS